MAVVWVKEAPTVEGAIDNTWKRTYKRTFRVLCDSRSDGPVTCINAGGIPSLGTSYYKSATEKDAGAWVQGLSSKMVSKVRVNGTSGGLHEVTVDYGPFNPYPKDPLQWPYKISWGFAPYERVVWFDINAKAIVNSAGVRFGEPVVMDDNRPILSITRNEATYDFTLADRLRDKVNSDTFLGADPGLVKVSAMPSEQLFNQETGQVYYTVKYDFHFNRDGWKKKILDCGFSQLDGSGNLIQLTSKGQPLQDAQLLDGSGHVLSSGAAPVSLEFEVYESISFADAFNFDESLIQGGSF